MELHPVQVFAQGKPFELLWLRAKVGTHETIGYAKVRTQLVGKTGIDAKLRLKSMDFTG